jgi:prolipoprotein diacylglyceryl transferase
MKGEFLSIWGVNIYLYAICVTLGIGAGYWLARKRAKKVRSKEEIVDSAFLWIFIPAVVGARLYHILSELSYYWENLEEVWAVKAGGMGIIGAILGGLVGLWVFTRRKRVKLWQLTDLLAPSLALAQSIGRWGNWFNQEAYGWPTDLPWGMFVEMENRLAGFEGFTHFHPWMVYESILNLVNFGMLMRISSVILRRNEVTTKNPLRNLDLTRRGFFVTRFARFLGMTGITRFFTEWSRRRNRSAKVDDEPGLRLRSVKNGRAGLVTALYLINYGLIRFFLEFLRVDTPEVFLGLKAAQLWGVGMVGVGVLTIWRTFVRNKIWSGD